MLSQYNIYKISIRIFVVGFKQKIHSKTSNYYNWWWLWLYLGWNWASWKFSFKVMWVLIVTSNITDDNNHNALLYVVFRYIIIKHQYLNIIWFFICFSVFSILLESVILSFFKRNSCPNVSNSIKYGSKLCNLFFANGKR